MRTVQITIEYDGDRFFGFQRQPDAHTLQSELEGVLSEILERQCAVRYAGRTDRGVHAKAQIVVFSDPGNIPLPKLLQILNKELHGIQVLSIQEIQKDFDPRRQARKRQYEYWCYFGDRHVFLDRFMWHRNDLPLDTIKKHLDGFLGVHDFQFLSKQNPQVLSTVRELLSVSATIRPYNFLNYNGESLVLTFEANSFLHHMVRKMVGLIWSLAEGQLSKSDFEDIINVRSRHRFAMAPAQGLYLNKIWYDEGAREFNNEK
jgi:tRNA pseudouridine38-40 synthase